MTPEEIREKGLFPAGFLPLPHPNHPEGGMLFPKFHIDEIKKQEGRDLTRFDLDFDLPDHFLPEFPPPIFLTTRTGSRRRLEGQARHDRELRGALQGHPEPEAAGRPAAAGHAVSAAAVQRDRRPPQREGQPRRDLLRLPRQRPHQRRDAPGRRHSAAGVSPSHRRAVACAASTFSGSSARSGHCGVIEDFTEFEQRAAYFDGDHLTAAQKGVNILERGSQVHFMSEFQSLLDFPPAPKLDVFGKLDPRRRPRARSAARRCSTARPSARSATRRRTTPTTRCTT